MSRDARQSLLSEVVCQDLSIVKTNDFNSEHHHQHHHRPIAIFARTLRYLCHLRLDAAPLSCVRSVCIHCWNEGREWSWVWVLLQSSMGILVLQLADLLLIVSMLWTGTIGWHSAPGIPTGCVLRAFAFICWIVKGSGPSSPLSRKNIHWHKATICQSFS